MNLPQKHQRRFDKKVLKSRTNCKNIP